MRLIPDEMSVFIGPGAQKKMYNRAPNQSEIVLNSVQTVDKSKLNLWVYC